MGENLPDVGHAGDLLDAVVKPREHIRFVGEAYDLVSGRLVAGDVAERLRARNVTGQREVNDGPTPPIARVGLISLDCRGRSAAAILFSITMHVPSVSITTSPRLSLSMLLSRHRRAFWTHVHHASSAASTGWRRRPAPAAPHRHRRACVARAATSGGRSGLADPARVAHAHPPYLRPHVVAAVHCQSFLRDRQRTCPRTPRDRPVRQHVP